MSLFPQQPEVAPAPAQQAADAPTPPKQNAGVLVPEVSDVSQLYIMMMIRIAHFL